MIRLSFPDGSDRYFASGTTCMQVAESLSKSLSKNAIVAEYNGELVDLSTNLKEDGELRILTNKDEKALEVIRHDTAHILAEAAKELFPNIQVTIGPPIKDGFYYDFATEKPFTESDMSSIENKMRQIIKQDNMFTKEICTREEAIEIFNKMGEKYKVEIIKNIPEDQQITLYRQGNFVDLCRGPHSPSTGKLKYFKLMKVAGAYWRGDSKNEALQRIYGTAWASQEQLDSYLKQLDEAEKRDHRKLGQALDLFTIHNESQGMVFWHPKGWTIYKTLEKYIRRKLEKNSYVEVRTPIMADKMLWENSGHWAKFRQNMFTSMIDDDVYVLKPMNCPLHIKIFNQKVRSYKDLPYRIAEFGCCHRNEPSGSLHGLLRVRNFVQDDAHIFCTESQINSETVQFCKLLQEVYSDFGFNKIKVRFSDRPEQREGSDEIWNKSESALKNAVQDAGLDWELNPGEGAFYGPKLEFVLTDAVGREWQCGTLQVDFVLPLKFNVKYVDSDDQKQAPVMLHRAIFGTFERFIGILIEEFAGKFPLWLAPIQIALVGLTSDFDEHITNMKRQFIDAGIRCEIDNSNEHFKTKIANFLKEKIPIVGVVGKNEFENSTVTLRRLGEQKLETVSVQELIDLILNENNSYLA